MIGAVALALRPTFLLAADSKETMAKLAALERQHGGRLGVAMLDTGDGRRVGYRADERFLLCSTFKLLLVAAVLARVDRGVARLDQRFVFNQDAVLEYAPITRLRVGAPGMTIAELCAAAITVSDNTAANVLMANLGGPAMVTAYARQLGDPITRLDRIEPALNRPSPDHVSDTTTPDAMLGDMRALLLGHALSEGSRAQLLAWLRGTTTGKKLLRAGLPAAWRIGEKTGSGDTQTNDVAIVWPPRRKPWLVTAYYENATTDYDGRSAVLAQVGRLIAAW
ncbi:class A beta-lactamase [Dyella jejuensis]